MAGTTRDAQRARTRTVLLDATVGCLVEYGYAETTTQRIQEEAGVSRGALLHHFGTKSELLVAAIHHIADVRLAGITELSKGIGEEDDSLSAVVSAIRTSMSGPMFQAAMELWSAARTNPELRNALVPAERRLGSEVRALFDAYSGIDDADRARTAFESLMAIIRGLAITENVRDDRAIADRVVDGWLASLRETLTVDRPG